MGANYTAYNGDYYETTTGGVKAGIVGLTSGDYFSFTVGAGVPSVFNFGILTNFSNSNEVPTTITLTSGATTASDSPVQNSGYFGRDNLFTITGATPGQTFTVNVSNEFISGATFDTIVASAPEPSAWLSLAVGMLSLTTLALRARKRSYSL